MNNIQSPLTDLRIVSQNLIRKLSPDFKIWFVAHAQIWSFSWNSWNLYSQEFCSLEQTSLLEQSVKQTSWYFLGYKNFPSRKSAMVIHWQQQNISINRETYTPARSKLGCAKVRTPENTFDWKLLHQPYHKEGHHQAPW